MLKPRAIVLATLTLLLAACGGGGSPQAAATAKPTPTPTAAPTPTPTADPLALVATFAGIYKGTWNNTTFGSSGPVEVDVTVDQTARAVTVKTTLGGNVFGAPAPPPETITIPASGVNPNGPLTYKSAIFGDCSGGLNGATFTTKCVNVPSARVSEFDSTGTITDPKNLAFTYTVMFKDGSAPAQGKVTLTKQ